MSGFKLLVGAAAVAVLAFVGYYFIGEYQQSQLRAEAAERMRLRQDCLQVLSNGGDATRPDFLNSCLIRGLVGQADVDEAVEKLRLK